MKDVLAERVLTLERRLSGLQAEVDAANARTAMTAGAYQLRIGRITGEPQDAHNTFDVIFEDGTFTEAAGDQSPDYTDRQLVARTVVHNLATVKIPADTRVPCWYWSDRWWTWWKEGTESTPSDPRMIGFNKLVDSMEDLTYAEDRVATFDDSDLIGTLSGIEWDNDEQAWTLELGDWYTNWWIQGHSSCSFGTDYPDDFEVNYLYGNLEYRNVPTDEDPDPTWENVPDARLYCYAAQGGYWNSASRGLMLRLTEDPKQVRMVCGIGQSSSAACSTGHIYYSHWHWTKAEFG